MKTLFPMNMILTGCFMLSMRMRTLDKGVVLGNARAQQDCRGDLLVAEATASALGAPMKRKGADQP